MGFYRHKKSILNRHKIREWTDSVGHDKHYAGVCKKHIAVYGSLISKLKERYRTQSLHDPEAKR
jgi:hypothetical protein